MENVLLDRSSGSFEYPKRGFYGGGGGTRPARPHGAYGSSRTCPQYHHFQKGGAWSSAPAPALPYARPVIYSSPSLPLPPSNQPPLLPLPPTATKYTTFSYPPPPAPQRTARPAAAMTVMPAAAPPASSPQLKQSERRRRPAKPPATEPTRVQKKKKKPLERATPLPSATVVTEALDDLEQEVARSFVQDLLHALAPPPSSLPLPRFSLVVKASSSSATTRAPAAPSCNAEAGTADGLRRLLRL